MTFEDRVLNLSDPELERRAFSFFNRTDKITLALTPSQRLTAPAAERFRIIPSGEFIERPRPAWLIKGILPQAELIVIFGEPGSGKSFLAYDLGAALSRGINWRGRRTHKGRVVYLAAEGVAGFRSRVEAYAAAHEVDHDDLPAIVDDVPDLRDAKDAALIARRVLDAGGAALIVVDTLAASFQGDENSSKDVAPVLANCKWLSRKIGATVLLIHHCGKDRARGARGWSGIRGAVDAELEVTREGGARSLRVTKQKDGEDGSVLPFRLRPVSIGLDDDGEPVSSCVVEHLEGAAAIKAAPPPRKPRRMGARDSRLLRTLNSKMDYEEWLHRAVAQHLEDEPNTRTKPGALLRNYRESADRLIADRCVYRSGTRVSREPIPEPAESWEDTTDVARAAALDATEEQK